MEKKVKGKAFGHSAPGNRRKGDDYPTPYSLTERLLEVEKFGKGSKILEPAAGKQKAIVKVLEAQGFNVTSRDIITGQDFLRGDVEKFPYIITNPPYALADEFVERCRATATKKFALLLRTNFLSGQRRIKDQRFRELKKVWIFSRMPDLTQDLRKDGKFKTAMIVYAWFVFEKGYMGAPEIGWIENSADVAKGRT